MSRNTKLEMMIASHVFGCISTDPGLPRQKNKWETCAKKSAKSNNVKEDSFEIWFRKSI